MVAACHHYAAAKALYDTGYAHVVGSHAHVADYLRHLFDNSLYHRLAAKKGKRLARKASGSIAGGYDCNEFHAAKLTIFCEFFLAFPTDLLTLSRQKNY